MSKEEPQALPRPRFSRRRLAVAFTLAALADGLSVFLTLTPPVEWAADLVTAILLFMVLGWQWILLPGLIMEAIPGLYVFPFWVLVVGAVAVWGTARPGRSPTSSGAASSRSTLGCGASSSRCSTASSERAGSSASRGSEPGV